VSFSRENRCRRHGSGNNQVLDGMEMHQRSGFKDMHRFLGSLPSPLPAAKGGRGMSNFDAFAGGFLLKMDEEQQEKFSFSELLLLHV
jgi:hypothetical protein